METVCGETFAWGFEGDGGETECGSEEGCEGATEGMTHEPDVGCWVEYG